MTTQAMLDAIRDARRPGATQWMWNGVTTTILEELVKRDEARERALKDIEAKLKDKES